MWKRLFFIAFIAAGIAFWVGLDVLNRPAQTIDSRNTAVDPSPVLTLDPRGADARPPESSVVMAGEADAIREVSVFGGAFSVRVYPADVFGAFRPREGPIANYYDSLAQAANAGDANAAFELGFALNRCVGYATTEQELDDKLNTMYQTHLLEDPYNVRSRYVEDINGFIKIERERYEICKGLSEEQIATFHHRFTVAAELGNYFAQMGAIEHALDRYWLAQGLIPNVENFDDVVDAMSKFSAAEPEQLHQAIDFMFAARAQGSLQALHDLALLYAAEVLKPPNEHSANANAYANLRAASEVWRQIWSPGSYNYDEDLRRLSDRLSIYELNWAEEQAQAILREENCCKEW
jgi:hypothetical protein